MATPEMQDDIMAALASYRNGTYSTIRQAALAWEVPKSTLARQNRGGRNRPAADQSQQKLSVQEENVLVEYVQQQNKAGYSLSVRALSQVANIILARRQPLGLSVADSRVWDPFRYGIGISVAITRFAAFKYPGMISKSISTSSFIGVAIDQLASSML